MVVPLSVDKPLAVWPDAPAHATPPSIPLPWDSQITTTDEMRARVEQFGLDLSQFPVVQCPVKHHFVPGLYGREIFIPAGTYLVGMTHRIDNLVVLSQGTIRIVTANGPIEISAPHTMVCKAGTRNAAETLTDVVWTNFFATDETDIDKLVEVISYATADEIMGGKNNIQTLANLAKQQEDLLCQ